MLCPAGMALELASPLLPGAFLLLACLGSIARAVTGVAGGATRMALTQHFARRRNAADIAAKEGSQVRCGLLRFQPPVWICCFPKAHAGAQTGTSWDPSLRDGWAGLNSHALRQRHPRGRRGLPAHAPGLSHL